MLAKPGAPFGLPLNPDQWLYFLTLAVLLAAVWLGGQPAARAGGAGDRRAPR